MVNDGIALGGADTFPNLQPVLGSVKRLQLPGGSHQFKSWCRRGKDLQLRLEHQRGLSQLRYRAFAEVKVRRPRHCGDQAADLSTTVLPLERRLAFTRAALSGGFLESQRCSGATPERGLGGVSGLRNGIRLRCWYHGQGAAWNGRWWPRSTLVRARPAWCRTVYLRIAGRAVRWFVR